MKILIAIMAFSLAVLMNLSCTKQKASNCNRSHAKVLRYDCDRVILQITDGSIAGDADWEDVTTGIHYSNVVSYHNTCAFQLLTNNIIWEIYMEGARVVQNPTVPEGCIQCMAISQNPPQTKIDIGRLVLGPCEKNK